MSRRRDLDVGQPGVVVDRDVDVVEPDDRALLALVAGRGPAMHFRTAALGDPTELLDVHMGQIARTGSLVADRVLGRGTDHDPGDRVAHGQVRHVVTGQDPRDRAGRDLTGRGDLIAPQPVSLPLGQHPLFELGVRLARTAVRPARAILQASHSFTGVAVQPLGHTLARYPHRRSDMGLFPASLAALHHQEPTGHGEPSITVRHETLRLRVGPRQPHPNRGFSRSSTASFRHETRYQPLGRSQLRARARTPATNHQPLHHAVTVARRRPGGAW